MIKPFNKPIHVTRPFLPPIENIYKGLLDIWDSRILTNHGPFLRTFERRLCEFIGTDNVCIVNNGTSALQIALRGMGIKGEVITTPFTFVATTNALVLNGIDPIFVDIEPIYYTIDPDRVEAAISPRTTAILAVHVYGHPCKIEALMDIASRHNLKLIFDSAHAFGVTVNHKHMAHYGDINVYSFHATKLFHSLEGGMITFRSPELKEKFDYLKNHGFKNEVDVVMPGTNAKMNELQALIGKEVLKHIDNIIYNRSQIYELYRKYLSIIPGIEIVPHLPQNTAYNYAYMPIEVDKDKFGIDRDSLYKQLKNWNVYSRRYFFPLICDHSCYKTIINKNPLPVARRVANRILCLPLFEGLSLSDVKKIVEIIKYISHYNKLPIDEYQDLKIAIRQLGR